MRFKAFWSRPRSHTLFAVVVMTLLASTTMVAVAAPAQAVCRPGIPGCPGGDEDPPPPPPPPAPACDTDEQKAIAREWVAGNEIAHLTPHIRWCWIYDGSRNRLTEVTRSADLTVELKGIGYDWTYVGEKSNAYIDGQGIGHYVQAIKILFGAKVTIGSEKGLGGSCTMTINRQYDPGIFVPSKGILDDLGSCKWLMNNSAPVLPWFTPRLLISDIPQVVPAPLPFPPTEVVWVEPNPQQPDEQLDIRGEDGSLLDTTRFDDFVDSPIYFSGGSNPDPCGCGGGDIDPRWVDAFYDEVFEVAA